MSSTRDLDLETRGDELETLRVEPPAPVSAPNTPQFHHSPWQQKLGNSSVAAAAVSPPPPNGAGTFSLQHAYGNAFVAHSLIQMKADDDAGPGSGLSTAPVPPATPGANPSTTPTPELIVDDTAAPTSPAQMKKSQFLTELRTAIDNAATETLAGTQWESQAGPRITQTFAQYSSQSSKQLEQSIRRYAPETAGATTARQVISMSTTRFRRSVTLAMATGQVPGMPTAAGVAGLIGDAATTAVSTIGNAVSGLFMKERDASASASDNPEAIRSQLGPGQSLDTGVRSRMETAFGESLNGVSVHADATAASLSDNMGARAFTVGSDIAFGAGEYRPGTIVGDALIAHELAHVMQQRRGAASDLPAQKGAGDYGALEEDADTAAVGAIVSTWDLGKSGLAGLATKSLRNLKSGLRLQKMDCSCGGKKETTPTAVVKFSDLKRIWPTLKTPAERDTALNSAIAFARSNAHTLFKTAGSNPILGIRQRIETATGTNLEDNPMIGVTQDNVEQAYRSWAEGAGVDPWIVLGVWKKEGLGKTVPDTITASTADHAKAIYRSRAYYIQMGADHFIHYTASSGDNAASFTDADAANHDTAFRTRITEQVVAGRLPRDISAEINSELNATLAGPGQFKVVPTSRFYTLSLLLVAAFYRENEAAVAADPRIGANPDPGLVYMRWNLGPSRFAPAVASAEGHRKEPAHARPDGGAPSISQWAFETRVAPGEYDVPRKNAIRYRYFVEVFRLIYEGW